MTWRWIEEPHKDSARKCPGCRCVAPRTNRKCGCCGLWPDVLNCVVCGEVGRFDTDLMMLQAGPTHDRCRAPYPEEPAE